MYGDRRKVIDCSYHASFGGKRCPPFLRRVTILLRMLSTLLLSCRSNNAHKSLYLVWLFELIVPLFGVQKLSKNRSLKFPGLKVWCYFHVTVTEVTAWWETCRCNRREEHQCGMTLKSKTLKTLLGVKHLDDSGPEFPRYDVDKISWTVIGFVLARFLSIELIIPLINSKPLTVSDNFPWEVV